MGISKKKAKKDLELSAKVKEFKKLNQNIQSLSELVKKCKTVQAQVKENLLKCGVPSSVLEEEYEEVSNFKLEVRVDSPEAPSASELSPTFVSPPCISRKNTPVHKREDPVRQNFFSAFSSITSSSKTKPESVSDSVDTQYGHLSQDVTHKHSSDIKKKHSSASVTKKHSSVSVHSSPTPTQHSVEQSPMKCDESEDDVICLGSDVEVDADLTKVKSEKGATGGSVFSHKTLRAMITQTTDGKILCPLKCGKSFTTANNMYIHVEHQVCQKKLGEHENMLRCQ